MDFPKIAGWILLIAGLILIVWTLYSSFNIFTNSVPPPQIFEISEKETFSSSEEGMPGFQSQIEDMVKGQLEGIIPSDTLPKVLNLAAWAMLAGILILGGAKISGLGIKLIK